MDFHSTEGLYSEAYAACETIQLFHFHPIDLDAIRLDLSIHCSASIDVYQRKYFNFLHLTLPLYSGPANGIQLSQAGLFE